MGLGKSLMLLFALLATTLALCITRLAWSLYYSFRWGRSYEGAGSVQSFDIRAVALANLPA